MNPIRTMAIAGMLAIAAGILAISVSASPAGSWFLGDTITLSGYSPESGTVYLFLTGPNLPSNGVALDDIGARADRGGLTRVRVDDNDRWVYQWDTHAVGGQLGPGTYTVWVTGEPVDLSRLNGASYRTIPITLLKPGISVSSPVLPGGLLLRSTPNGSSVVLNGEYRGKSPLAVEDLEPGIYNVTFSRFGYTQRTLQVTVESGRQTEADVTLSPERGSLAITTRPGGARVMLDGADAGVSPVVLTDVPSGSHTLLFTKEGFAPMEQEVRVVTNTTVAVDITLASVVQATATQRAGSLIPSVIQMVFIAVLFIRIRHLRSVK